MWLPHSSAGRRGPRARAGSSQAPGRCRASGRSASRAPRPCARVMNRRRPISPFESPSATSASTSRSRSESSSRGRLASASEQPRDDARVDDRLAVRQPPERVDEDRGIADALLEQVAGALGILLEESHREARLDVLGEHEHADLGVEFTDPLRGDDPLVRVRRRHADVDDRAVGLLRRDRTHQAVDVSGLTHHLHARRGRARGAIPSRVSITSSAMTTRTRRVCHFPGPVPATVLVSGGTDERPGFHSYGSPVILEGERCERRQPNTARSRRCGRRRGGGGLGRAAARSRVASPGGTYRVGVESFYGSPFPWARRLRPDGEFDTCGAGDLHEPRSSALSLARITLPGQPGATSFPTSRSACRPRRTAARPTHSGSSGESGSGRLSTARSLRATSATRSSGSRGPRTRSAYASAFDDIQGFGAYRRGKAPSISGIVTPNAKTITFTPDPAGR